MSDTSTLAPECAGRVNPCAQECCVNLRPHALLLHKLFHSVVRVPENGISSDPHITSCVSRSCKLYRRAVVSGCAAAAARCGGAERQSGSSRRTSSRSRTTSSSYAAGSGKAAANNIEREGESPYTHATEARTWLIASKYQPQPFDGEDDRWREWVRVFRSWSGGALAEIYEQLESHEKKKRPCNH